MKTNTLLYFDCFSGISGDMCLGALLDLGIPADYLTDKLSLVPIRDYHIEFLSVTKKGIGATKVNILQKNRQVFRHLPDIEKLIAASHLSPWVKEQSFVAFTKLAAAEAVVHRTTVDKIHFHEVGALDSIIDIIGTFILVEYLKPTKVMASSIPLGSGFVRCEHGLLPVPAPATLELLAGVPVNSFLTGGELVTPTGAAIITTLADEFASIPTGIINKVGYGAGTKDFDHPNVLRTLLIQSSSAPRCSNEPCPTCDQVVVIETTIDDMTGEALGFLLEKLFAAKALDCYYAPIYMKKNRPAQKLTVLCSTECQPEILTALFRHSSTFGARIVSQERVKLDRIFQMVTTPFGQVQLKLGYLNQDLVQVSPEYEDCARLAELHQVPLAIVFQAALAEFGAF
ncbi:MAG: nickel pincer cofactor biosynthesis protein LarC [Clostridia bacterium]|nr:nickel pincer cofactor biosynthesis protein LarC [Clostridia bacterium]